MFESTSINCTSKMNKDFPLNDLRVKFGNEVIQYSEKAINYQKLRSFIIKNFNFHKDYELVIKYFTSYGIQIKIKNEERLRNALDSMSNLCGVFEVTLKNQTQKENRIVDYFYSSKEGVLKKEDNMNRENKDQIMIEEKISVKDNHFFNSSPHNSHSIQSNLSIFDSRNEGNETILDDDDDDDNNNYDEKNNDHSSNYEDLKQKYQKIVRSKATRFSRIKGRKELCNTKEEQDKFEEWLIIAKNNFKKFTKRYNDNTTLAIFFDKFSINLRIRIQLYTHKSMKSKKTSRTFTFFRSGVDKNWDLLTAAKKLENFLKFAVENLFVIKGPIFLSDF